MTTAAVTSPERSRWWARDWRDHELWAPGSILPSHRVPMETYHAGPGVSKSMLDRAHRTIHSMLHHVEAPADEQPSYLPFGSAVNDAILDPGRFEFRYVRGPADRRGARWKEAVAEAGPDRVVMVERDYDAAVAWRDAVYAHPTARRLVEGALHTEVSLVWEDQTGLLLRCRPDILTASGNVIDLKTARSADPWEFRAAVFSRRYHVSAALTAKGVETIIGRPKGYIFMVLDKDLPPAPESVALFQLDEPFRDEGWCAVRADLDRLAGYLSAATRGEEAWSGYPTDLQLIPHRRS